MVGTQVGWVLGGPTPLLGFPVPCMLSRDPRVRLETREVQGRGPAASERGGRGRETSYGVESHPHTQPTPAIHKDTQTDEEETSPECDWVGSSFIFSKARPSSPVGPEETRRAGSGNLDVETSRNVPHSPSRPSPNPSSRPRLPPRGEVPVWVPLLGGVRS